MYVGFAPPTTNREDWTLVCELTDSETGTDGDITGATITVGLRPPDQTLCIYNVGTASGHVTITAANQFEISLSRSEMSVLAPDEYELGIVIELDGGITQLFTGSLPVLDGIVDP